MLGPFLWIIGQVASTIDKNRLPMPHKSILSLRQAIGPGFFHVSRQDKRELSMSHYLVDCEFLIFDCDSLDIRDHRALSLGFERLEDQLHLVRDLPVDRLVMHTRARKEIDIEFKNSLQLSSLDFPLKGRDRREGLLECIIKHNLFLDVV